MSPAPVPPPGPPIPGQTYRIALCSGEERHWRFLGAGPDGAWWRDVETGREFSEASLMYAWTILTDPAAPSNAPPPI